MESGKPRGLKGPRDVGTGRVEDEQVPLSRVVDVLPTSASEPNSPPPTSSSGNRSAPTRPPANPFATRAKQTRSDNFAYVFDPKLEDLVMNSMDRNSDQAVKFLENPELRSFITRLIRNQVYDRIQSEMKGLAKGHSVPS